MTRFLTSEDVRRANSRVIEVEEGTIVTAQAQDTAREAGIVIKTRNGHAVYHMGDTDVFPGMELIQALHKPQIGIVPIGDRFTMGAHSAAFACKRYFHFKTILPCHYGTFPGMLAPNADAFVTEMGPAVKVPRVGEPLTL